MNCSLNQIALNNCFFMDLRGCPYDAEGTGICAASLSEMAIRPDIREGYCESENYDNCPIFLSKIMRKKG